MRHASTKSLTRDISAQTSAHRKTMTELIEISCMPDALNAQIEAAAQAIDAWAGSLGLTAAMRSLPDMPVHLAGGAVRDTLRGSSRLKDFDIFVTGADFKRFVDHLAQYGNITYGPFGSPRWYPGNNATYADIISVNNFENGVERCSNIDDALRQFDFTANAVAIDLRTFSFHNPIGGLEDAQNSIMRCVRFDYPDELIAPGELLSRNEVVWLRLVHYSNILGLTLEPNTRSWVERHASYERAAPIFAERFFPPVLKVTL